MLLEQGLDVGLELALGAAVHVHDVPVTTLMGRGWVGSIGGILTLLLVLLMLTLQKFQGQVGIKGFVDSTAQKPHGLQNHPDS